jgi:hypothetical protein
MSENASEMGSEKVADDAPEALEIAEESGAFFETCAANPEGATGAVGIVGVETEATWNSSPAYCAKTRGEEIDNAKNTVAVLILVFMVDGASRDC